MSDYFYASRMFEGFDEYSENLTQWNIQTKQLSCGKCINGFKQLSHGSSKLNYLQLNGHKTTIGDPPPGKTFAFWCGDNSELVWRKQKVKQNSLMIYPNGGEHDVMTKGVNMHVFAITLSDAIWRTSLSDNDADVFHQLMSSNELVNLPENSMLQLRHLFHTYFIILENSPELLAVESFRNKADQQIFEAITRVLSLTSNTSSSLVNVRATLKTWDKIDTILKKASNSTMLVSELSNAAGVSDRSLRRLFHDRYGVSPKEFLNRGRLNKVRLDLKRCYGSKSKIADVANNHGFWHMGQFAADYKKLFGELPSTTFNKCEKLFEPQELTRHEKPEY